MAHCQWGRLSFHRSRQHIRRITHSAYALHDGLVATNVGPGRVRGGRGRVGLRLWSVANENWLWGRDAIGTTWARGGVVTGSPAIGACLSPGATISSASGSPHRQRIPRTVQVHEYPMLRQGHQSFSSELHCSRWCN